MAHDDTTAAAPTTLRRRREGRPALVAAAMLGLLGLSLVGAYASIQRPPVAVTLEDLSLTLPPYWRAEGEVSRTPLGPAWSFGDPASPGQRLEVRRLTLAEPLDESAERVEQVLRSLAPRVVPGLALPDDAAVLTPTLRGATAAVWSDRVLQRLPDGRERELGTWTLATVTDDGTRYWLLVLHDRPDPARTDDEHTAHAATQRERLVGILRTLAFTPETPGTPDAPDETPPPTP